MDNQRWAERDDHRTDEGASGFLRMLKGLGDDSIQAGNARDLKASSTRAELSEPAVTQVDDEIKVDDTDFLLELMSLDEVPASSPGRAPRPSQRIPQKRVGIRTLPDHDKRSPTFRGHEILVASDNTPATTWL